MGATYNSVMIRAKTTQALEKKFNAVLRSLTREYGTDPYNGTLSTTDGLKICPDKVFKTRQEADKWLDDNTDKWLEAVAVKCSEAPTQKMWDDKKKDFVTPPKGNWWVVGGQCSI